MWRDMRAAAKATAKAAEAAASGTAGAAGSAAFRFVQRWSCDKLLKVSSRPTARAALARHLLARPLARPPPSRSPSFPLFRPPNHPPAPACPPARPPARPPALTCTCGMRQALEQVYPEEAPQPVGIAPSITLRPYQKQSLAFMLAIENSTDASLVGERPAENLQVHLARAAGCDAQASYRDRRAGVKADLNNGPAPPTRSVRGGWLCDEVGMGSAAWSKRSDSHSGSGRAGHLWLGVPSRLSTAALWAPEKSCGHLGPAVPPWILSEAPPKSPIHCV